MPLSDDFGELLNAFVAGAVANQGTRETPEILVAPADRPSLDNVAESLSATVLTGGLAAGPSYREVHHLQLAWEPEWDAVADLFLSAIADHTFKLAIGIADDSGADTSGVDEADSLESLTFAIDDLIAHSSDLNKVMVPATVSAVFEFVTQEVWEELVEIGRHEPVLYAANAAYQTARRFETLGEAQEFADG